LKKKTNSLFLIIILLIILFAFSPETEIVKAATVYYVSTTGNDSTGTGIISNPWKTIQKAANSMTAGDTCIIRSGTYRETVTPVYSGSSAGPITFKAYEGETVTVSGANLVTGWVKYSEGIYYAPMTGSLGSKDQIFVSGEMQMQARWPNSTVLDPLNSTFGTVESGSASTINDKELNQPFGYWVGKTLWCVPGTGYKSYSSTITGSDKGSITFEAMGAAAAGGNSYYITGNLQELDSPGEWYYDSSTARLYLWAQGGINPGTVTVEAKKRSYAFDLSSRSYINISGINIFAASINMSESNYCKISNMTANYISHDTDLTKQYNTGIFMSGSNNELRNSTLLYSSGNLVSIQYIYHCFYPAGYPYGRK
jgi:hypothetical protein